MADRYTSQHHTNSFPLKMLECHQERAVQARSEIFGITQCPLVSLLRVNLLCFTWKISLYMQEEGSRLCSSVWLFCMGMTFNYPDWSLQCGLWKAYGWKSENKLIPELGYSHSLQGNQTSPHQSSCNAHFHIQYRFPCRDCPCSSTASCCRCWESKCKKYQRLHETWAFLNPKQGKNN